MVPTVYVTVASLPATHALTRRFILQDTAAFWQSQGQLEQPVQADGLLDFLGLGPNTTTTDGTSGADTEIGPGVYVIDDQETYVPRPVLNAPCNRHAG